MLLELALLDVIRVIHKSLPCRWMDFAADAKAFRGGVVVVVVVAGEKETFSAIFSL